MSRALARTNTSLWWIACFFVCAFYVVTVPRLWQCEGVDEIEYLGLSHSLARGYGYTLYGEPYGYYPPLFPAVLSMIMRWNVAAWRWMYAANALLGLVGLIVGATWLRRFSRVGVWAGWFSLFAYYAWSFSTRYLLSEPLFFALSVFVIILVWRVLERNRCSIPEGFLIGAGALLCAMTRLGAVALLGGLGFAALIRWLISRVRTGLVVGLILLVTGGGFMIAWEVRAQVVNPNAVESYGRWAAKFLGLSDEKAGMIAKSVGEGTVRELSWPRRAIESGIRYSQYVASVVRPPRNFAPLAVFLWALFLTGIASHLRWYPWSPAAWYTVATIAMISLTSWLSSYVRYYFPLTPFLFFFLLSGAQAWRRVLIESPEWQLRRVVGLWGMVGLIWSLLCWPALVAGCQEAVYGLAMWFLCLAAYGVMFVLGLDFLFRRSLIHMLRRPVTAMAGIVIIYGLHSVAVASERSRLIQSNQALKAKNLDGVVEVGRWLRQSSPASSVCVASFPRLVSFLADRTCLDPLFNAGGKLELDGIGYVVTTGDLMGVPAFRRVDERALCESIAGEKTWIVIFKSEGAEVFRREMPDVQR